MKAILIGGPPLLGKSELAIKYAGRLAIAQIFRTDNLRNTVRYWCALRQCDAHRHLSIGLFPQELDSQYFAQFVDRQASELYAIAIKHLQICASRGQSVIIEGTHLFPSMDMSPEFVGLTLRRYVLMTSTLEQYEVLAQPRSIQRYGETCGRKRFMNYRRLWTIYKRALAFPCGQMRVLDAAMGLDVCLETIVDEMADLQGFENA